MHVLVYTYHSSTHAKFEQEGVLHKSVLFVNRIEERTVLSLEVDHVDLTGIPAVETALFNV